VHETQEDGVPSLAPMPTQLHEELASGAPDDIEQFLPGMTAPWQEDLRQDAR
jgi:hypothetical protein